ncbi:selenite/tellurite reduction operon c-type cytochrome lipoprotein ExtS [Desulfuromonas sp. AOP6]|uniref:selenite/tellurite reduction operon c-type cytochrome lipoprotein ExtS n=1 Tax=Desulfuromonas sp. AOP6 TaxID=1566351 RepID=UPI00127ABBEB|nr:selenite/tellurite reduction operon c-type cytochrome lipoprotein ExtS [Desulfuromonas sp. AOP6]BCA78867.1 cytochrome c [Desulfuromonas sp. AOP6]
MVFRAALLILLLSLSVGTACAATGPPLCLRCHEVHYDSQGTCTDCHRGHPGTTRIEIAHDRFVPGRLATFSQPDSPVIKRGTTLTDKAGCRRCHTLGGKGTTLASNLDRTAAATPPLDLEESIRQPVALMPDFRFGTDDVAALVTLLLKEGVATPRQDTEVPLVIHFEKEGAASENIFAKRCGGCHRALTVKEGGLGDGETAPNLSGLLTPYYPRSAEKPGKDAPWSEKDLEDWLKNPRKLRPLTRMQPIVFKDGEFSQLIQTLHIAVPPPLESVSP